MNLSIVHEELVQELREGMNTIAHGDPAVELADVCETLSIQFEALGVCHLFEFADTVELRNNLVRSAHSRRCFLQRSKAEGNDRDRHLALGRSRAFLDAMVAGSLPLARDIADLSSEIWIPSWEYEDDFCFFLFLHQIVKQPDPFPTPETHAIMARFERSLEGADSTRYEVCKALTTRDPATFASALEALIEEEKARIEADRESPAVHEGDIVYWATSRISIEGLALLQFAALLGIRAERSFELCPPLARLPFTDQRFLDLFEEIARIG